MFMHACTSQTQESLTRSADGGAGAGAGGSGAPLLSSSPLPTSCRRTPTSNVLSPSLPPSLSPSLSPSLPSPHPCSRFRSHRISLFPSPPLRRHSDYRMCSLLL